MLLQRISRATRSVTRLDRRAASTIGIRAEDAGRLWERRSPLTPLAVQQLVEQGNRVVVERCDKRIYNDASYIQAGAELTNSLQPTKCDLILGIKEIPPSHLVNSPATTYAFFSHTTKGQLGNLPLLSSMLASESRFIDYELLTNEQGQRTTAFGRLAGIAGMADGLSQFGMKALAQGAATAFLNLPRPFMLRSVSELKEAVARVGEQISRERTPKILGPLVVTIAGKGRVGEGAKEVLDLLPTVWVSAGELKGLVGSKHPDLSKVYACHVNLEDYLTHREGLPFDREVYRSHPEQFISDFDTKIAPYSTVFLNGGYWQKGCPRLMTTSQLAGVRKRLGPKSKYFSTIVDVSCDYDGGLEFITAPTTICDPITQFDAPTGLFHSDLTTPNTTQISSIEILPSELPLDASQHFSSSLLPYIHSLLVDPHSNSSDPLAVALRRATVVNHGRLTEKHEGLYSLLASSNQLRRKKVVMLGSGLVAGPAVKIIAARKDIDLVIASNALESAEHLAKDYSTVSAVLLDASDRVSMESLITDADVVISLLPAHLHVPVAELCIAHHTHFVSASYVSKEMSALDTKAKEAGVVLLNELGLDPGIDHMSAMSLITEAGMTGHDVNSFVSFCGGLPAPEDSAGPLGYKFSWSPRGVLTAALNPASFRIDSKDIAIDGPSLLSSAFASVPIIRGFNFEGVANRDSIAYLKEYGLPSDLPTILRGTLRYPGFSSVVQVWKEIGLLDQQVVDKPLQRWDQLVDRVLEQASGKKVKDAAGRRRMVKEMSAASYEVVDEALHTLSQLSLLPTTSTNARSSTLPSIPTSPQSPLDLLSVILAHQLAYSPTERDCVILHHELGTTERATGAKVLFTSTMVQYGEVGSFSAMATTVGMPIALGALICLDDKITHRGILSPASEQVWKPLLGELEKNGIKMIEKRCTGSERRGVLDTLRQSFDL